MWYKDKDRLVFRSHSHRTSFFLFDVAHRSYFSDKYSSTREDEQYIF